MVAHSVPCPTIGFSPVRAVVSILVEDTGSVLSLVGALCATPLMTVFPPLMLVRCSEFEAGQLTRALHIATCVAGAALTLGGTVLALLNV